MTNFEMLNTSEFIFTIDPMPKPRMTRRDRWKPTKQACRYFEYRDKIKLMCKLKKYVANEFMGLSFLIPMPKTWSKKKRAEMLGKPHKQTPDLDNLIKGFWDAVCDEDKHLWKVVAFKVWADEGKIIVVQ